MIGTSPHQERKTAGIQRQKDTTRDREPGFRHKKKGKIVRGGRTYKKPRPGEEKGGFGKKQLLSNRHWSLSPSNAPGPKRRFEKRGPGKTKWGKKQKHQNTATDWGGGDGPAKDWGQEPRGPLRRGEQAIIKKNMRWAPEATRANHRKGLLSVSNRKGKKKKKKKKKRDEEPRPYQGGVEGRQQKEVSQRPQKNPRRIWGDTRTIPQGKGLEQRPLQGPSKKSSPNRRKYRWKTERPKGESGGSKSREQEKVMAMHEKEDATTEKKPS